MDVYYDFALRDQVVDMHTMLLLKNATNCLQIDPIYFLFKEKFASELHSEKFLSEICFLEILFQKNYFSFSLLFRIIKNYTSSASFPDSESKLSRHEIYKLN